MWTLRQARQSDFNFIANSYLRSYRNSPEARRMPNPVYYEEYSLRLNKMISTSQVIVAHESADEDQIFGYVIFDELAGYPLLHYVYVKQLFRGCGVARSLLALLPDPQGRPVTCTHLPRRWDDANKKLSLIYDPKYARS